jgi:hypothetical protein
VLAALIPRSEPDDRCSGKVHQPHRTNLTACNLRRPADLHQRSSPTFLRLDGTQEVSILGLQKVSSAAGRRVSDGLEWLSFPTEQSVEGKRLGRHVQLDPRLQDCQARRAPEIAGERARDPQARQRIGEAVAAVGPGDPQPR